MITSPDHTINLVVAVFFQRVNVLKGCVLPCTNNYVRQSTSVICWTNPNMNCPFYIICWNIVHCPGILYSTSRPNVSTIDEWLGSLKFQILSEAILKLAAMHKKEYACRNITDYSKHKMKARSELKLL